MRVLKFIVSITWPIRFYLIGPFIMIFIHSLDLSIRPYLTKLIVDTISEKKVHQALYEVSNIIAIYVIILFIVPIGWRIYDWCCLKYEPVLKGLIAKKMIGRLTLQTHNFFQKNYAGSIANKVNDTISYVPQLVTIALNSFIMNFVSLFVATYAMWSIHIWFALAMSIWATIFTIMSIIVVRKFSELARSSSEASSKVVGMIVDIFTNISTVRYFARRNYEIDLLDDVQDQYTKASERKRIFSIKFYLVQGIIFALYQSISLLLLIYLYSHEKVTPGDFAMILSINTSIVTSLWHMSDQMRMFSENWGAVDQALKLMDTPIQIKESPNASELVVTKGKIELKHVTFHHKGETPLFNDLSVTIHPLEKVGLVGFSGSGKTTFANLILRLFDVNDGSILIDNKDIKNVTLESLRTSISSISQDVSLFNRSILNNIRYGKLDSSDDEVIEASKKASAHSFISSLPRGYNSKAGEKAVKLSSGQRQRISIARSLLKDSQILIFDEATNCLDPITEKYIQDNLKNIMSGKTCLVIAHSLSTLMSMDRILVFDKGEIVEDGPPSELIKLNGLFKELWNTQSNGLLPTSQES